MKQFAVIHVDDDFIQCVGIYADYFQSVGRAYDYASDLIDSTESAKKGSVTPLFELEGQTGLGLTVHCGDDLQLKANIYILAHEGEEEKEAET